MKNKLLIIGAGGHGKVIADIALKMNKWQSIAFLDDDRSIQKSMGIEVIGKTTDFYSHIEDSDIFVGLGNNFTRKKFQEELEKNGANIPVLYHPEAIIGEQVELSLGTVIMPGVVVNCCTNIGKGCIINTSATIDHDNSINDFVHVSTGAILAGSVSIGKRTWIGAGSTVSNNINITSDCKIGAGATVVGDITEAGTYVGVPAKRLLT